MTNLCIKNLKIWFSTVLSIYIVGCFAFFLKKSVKKPFNEDFILFYFKMEVNPNTVHI